MQEVQDTCFDSLQAMSQAAASQAFGEYREGHNVLKDITIVSYGRIVPCRVAGLMPCLLRG